MDPFSISTGVLAFTSVSIKVLMGLKQFKDSVKEANTSINALISDISGLRRVLHSMEETFQDIEDEQVLRQTGHIGTHWQNLHQCLNDGHNALSEFDTMLVELNKSVKVLDEARREIRIQSAATRIALFRQQVQAYKDTLQMCLQTIILWNSVSIQKTTSSIEPNLEAIHKEISRLAINVEVKIQAIQDLMIGSTGTDAIKNLARLNQCIDSAASVLSSASTILDDRRSWNGDDLDSIHPGSNRIEVVEWINRSETGTPSAELPSLPDLPELPGATASASTSTAGTVMITTPPSDTDPTPPTGHVTDSTSLAPFTSYIIPANSAIPPVPTAQSMVNQPPMYMYMTPQGWQAWNPNQMSQLTLAPSMYGQPGEPESSMAGQYIQQAVQQFEHTSYRPPLDIQAPTPPTAPSLVLPQVQAPTQTPPKVQVSTPDSETGSADPSTTTGTVTEAETALTQTHKRTKSGSRMSRFLSVRWKFQSPSGSKKSASGTRTARTFGRGADLRRKFVFIGDGACGKTCLLITTSKGTYPEVYVPTVFENYVADVEVQGVDGYVEVALWDTAGQEDYDRLRPLSYLDAHALIICFTIDSPDSLINIGEKWHAEGIHFMPNVPIFMVGCKQDLRYDAETISYLRKGSQQPVSITEGLAMASLINARCYIETSARTKHGINSVFSIIADEILRMPEFKNRPCAAGDFKKFKSELCSPTSHHQGPSAPTIRKLAQRYTQFSSGYSDPSGSTTWRPNDSELETGSPKVLEPSRSRSRFFKRAA
ncbi:aldehyde dehydrogenase 3, member A2 [Madurella fahalii]|uniref:Aldehyde dehydrogenase 3, member A2 n=1 Tax=Madurella fahalii TaxID=1157608 RepID=A0ABQ0GTE1_9PEZI